MLTNTGIKSVLTVVCYSIYDVMQHMICKKDITM